MNSNNRKNPPYTSPPEGFFRRLKRQGPRVLSNDLFRRLPLTARLTLLLVSLLTFGLGLSGATVLGILQSHLIGQVDYQLTWTVKKLSTTQDWENLAQPHPNQPSNYFVRINTGNEVRESVWQAAVEELGRPSPADLKRLEELAFLSISKPVTIRAEGSHALWRAITVPLTEGDEKAVGVATIALPLEAVHETVKNTRTYLITVSICIIFFCGLGAYYLVRYFLFPLRQIEEVAGHIADGELHERIVSREHASTEVGSLALSLNVMLARIESAFTAQRRSDERIRRFVSDASHELRTPLATIRGYGELYRIGGVPPERTDEVFQRIESEATRMGQLVEDLLKLARLDEGRQICMKPVNLYQIASNAALDLTALNPDRPVQLLHYKDRQPIDIAAGDELMIVADNNLLTQVMTNLVGNIDRYTGPAVPVEIMVGLTESRPPETTVHPPGSGPTSDLQNRQCVLENRKKTRPSHPRDDTFASLEISSATTWRKTDQFVIVQVCDHGGGIAASELEKVFERFYRGDTSRSRETGGTGLGLSIVSAVAAVHGGMARAITTEGGGLTVEIYLPYRPPAT